MRGQSQKGYLKNCLVLITGKKDKANFRKWKVLATKRGIGLSNIKLIAYANAACLTDMSWDIWQEG